MRKHTVAVRHDRLNTVTYSLWVEPTFSAAVDAAAAAPRRGASSPAEAAPCFRPARRLPRPRTRAEEHLPTAGRQARPLRGPLDRPPRHRRHAAHAHGARLRRDAQNGVGRNFLVQQYLREGDYQVTVAALGNSRGPPRACPGGHPARGRRRAAPRRAGARHPPRRPGGRLPCRRAGGGGYTLCAPSVSASSSSAASRTPTAGRSRNAEHPGGPRPDSRAGHLPLRPPPAAGRRPRSGAAREEAASRSNSPATARTRLPLEKPAENVWVEPEGPEGPPRSRGRRPRPPDVWQFELPAKAHAAVELTEEMQGTISRRRRRAPQDARSASCPPAAPGKASSRPAAIRSPPSARGATAGCATRSPSIPRSWSPASSAR